MAVDYWLVIEHLLSQPLRHPEWTKYVLGIFLRTRTNRRQTSFRFTDDLLMIYWWFTDITDIESWFQCWRPPFPVDIQSLGWMAYDKLQTLVNYSQSKRETEWRGH